MIRIFIVDDHQIFASSLHHLLEEEEDFEVVGTATHPEEAFKLMESKEVDVVLMDIRMGEDHMDGIEGTTYLNEHFPTVKVIILTMFNHGALIHQLLQQQVGGFLLKDSDVNDLIKAIKKVSKGETYYSVEIMKTLMDYQRQLYIKGPNVKLTPRERQVLQLLVEEYSTSEIGGILNIGDTGVETHRRNLRNKLDVKNTAGLVREAILRKLVDLNKFQKM
ncbi:MAG: response regulator transcription factor [Bacteroidia bacterium]|nr:response regulator transcription factor [Bacteroidia bacterium]